LTPLSRWNPSQRHASILVLGEGIWPSTFKAPKSVCVSSALAGPRSWFFGFGDAESVEEVMNGRAEWIANLWEVRSIERPAWCGKLEMHLMLRCACGEKRNLESSRILGR
jgi:hypothetical protein